MILQPRSVFASLAVLTALWTPSAAQTARISEETRVLTTYPFSEPNPVPILIQDARLYPYHAFDGYAQDGVSRPWKVVRLENDLVEVFVLPEVGGKVWGAVVKRTGHEFIYRNEVMKFRNIALRGPWTSGGIEFNFGVIGHTPSTATPVDYALRENPDGSVSCIVGTMDLPSRTHWRVEIRLPADRAAFETRVLWYNPTPLEQPYYNWMTAAAFARDDLEMFIPGNAFLEHSGRRHAWPVDGEGRYLPGYANNTFAGHKSYHVVGELNDFFGGYYHDEGYGFGHWARYEEMPGQKLWLWALSREGGVWEDLLTDTDGQYVEYQAGRLLVQYAPGADVNPITQVGFDPGAADRWSETWFPLEGLGGLTDASQDGAMYARWDDGRLRIRVQAFGDLADTLRVLAGDSAVASIPLMLRALEPVEHRITLPDSGAYRLELRALGLDHDSDARTRRLVRPFVTDSAAPAQIPPVQRQVTVGRELAKARRYHEARMVLDSAVVAQPWQRKARLALADLEYRRGRYAAGLDHALRVLQLDAYDADANFVAGNLYRALGRVVDAREAFGWAARAIAHRSAAYVQLAELTLAGGDHAEAARYARLALDFDRQSVPAHQILAMIGRQTHESALAESMQTALLEIDPLQHFVRAERYLAAPDSASGQRFLSALRSEFPDQTILELAVDYVRRGARDDARRLLTLGTSVMPNPLLRAWRAWLDDDPPELVGGADPTLVFPFRLETVPVLAWAAEHDRHWSWTYLLALNLWALDREGEAADQLERLGETPDFAPFYVARGLMRLRAGTGDPEGDLRRAVAIDGRSRVIRIQLVRYLLDRGQWEAALRESSTGRTLFPSDFNLDLLAVRSLNQLGRWAEAIEILNTTHVLPSENARESHRLYEQAHTLAALDAMEQGTFADARRYLQAALEWPEHLGQGRPYEPEERLVRYLLGVADRRLGDAAAARAAFEAVVRGTDRAANTASPLALLAIPALAALGRSAELSDRDWDETTGVGRAAAQLTQAVGDGAKLREVTARLAADPAAPFTDLDGRLLLQALTLTP